MIKSTWMERAARIQNNIGASFWLKDALRQAAQRDPLDAHGDAAILESILKARVDEALGRS